MDKLTVIKVIDLINNHIAEVKALPGATISKEPIIEELNLLIKELTAIVKK